jgi:hypothetical protein
MKIKMVKMRKKGVEVPKRMVFDRFAIAQVGKLVIMDATDQGLRRQVKVARLSGEDSRDVRAELIEPHVIWANDGRFMLTGFERGRNEAGEPVDYAQSWLCSVEVGQAELAPEIAGMPGRKAVSR